MIITTATTTNLLLLSLLNIIISFTVFQNKPQNALNYNLMKKNFNCKFEKKMGKVWF